MAQFRVVGYGVVRRRTSLRNGHAWSGTLEQVRQSLSVLGQSFTRYGILHSNKYLLCGGIMRCFKRNVRCFEVQPERRSGLSPLIQGSYFFAQTTVYFHNEKLYNFRTSIGKNTFCQNHMPPFNLVTNELTIKTYISNVPNLVVEYCFLLTNQIT